MKKIILSAIFLFTLASVSMAQTEKAAPADNKNAPSMKFKEEEFNFGTIKQGDKVVHEFEFENSGKEPLMITEAHGSCGCTVPDYPKDPIKPGEEGKLKVTFNSAGKSGHTMKTVTITCNTEKGVELINIKSFIKVPKK